jgi:hypothetical protein
MSESVRVTFECQAPPELPGTDLMMRVDGPGSLGTRGTRAEEEP